MLVSLQRRVADMGLLLEDYLKGQNKTLEQLKGEWRPQAEKNVRMELGLAEIARMENVNGEQVALSLHSLKLYINYPVNYCQLLIFAQLCTSLPVIHLYFHQSHPLN